MEKGKELYLAAASRHPSGSATTEYIATVRARASAARVRAGATMSRRTNLILVKTGAPVRR
eukprot:1975423-Pleurochrysis_carterae.AAC.1